MAIAVLHIGKYFPPHRGGMENYLADLMAAQQRQGLRPAALVHRSVPGLHDREERVDHGADSLRVYRSAVWMTLFFAPLAPLFPIAIQRCLRRYRPALLHLHLPNLSVFWLLLLPAARRLPWVVHWHADVVASSHSPALRLLYPMIYRPLEQALLRRAAAIISTSPPYLDSSEPLRAHRARCHVIPLGIDPRRLQREQPPAAAAANAGAAAREDAREAHDTQLLRVIAVGRLTYYKGLAYLIRALADCPGVQLTLVGDGDQAPLLRRQIAEAGLGERVILTGALSDHQLSAAIVASDLLCLPSIERTEAFGVVLLEAMALGVPVLATRVAGAGMAWVVERSGAGHLVPPADAAALARELTALHGERAKLPALGARGKTAVSEFFHIEQGCSAITRLYAQLLRTRTAS